MKSKEFQELIADRMEWVKSSEKNKFDFTDILVGPYNDPSHFIYEILQNAEDEKAKTVSFKLFDNRLEIFHDGEDFNFRDIEAITGIGNSPKKDDITAIGKFGFGFKSVYAITETPYIFSGNYSLRIDNYVVPTPDEVTENIIDHGTVILLPFNHHKRTPIEVFSLISKRLENVGLMSLLFLNHIEEIRWETPEKRGHYLKSSNELTSMSAVKKVFLVSDSAAEEYLVIHRPVMLDRDLYPKKCATCD